MNRLLLVTLQNLANEPYGDALIPWLVDDGWEVTVMAPGACDSVLRTILPYKRVAEDIQFPFCKNRMRHELSLIGKLLRGKGRDYDAVYWASQGIGWRGGLLSLIGGLPRNLVYQTYDYYDPIAFPWHSRLEGMVYRRCRFHLNAEYHRAEIYSAIHGARTPTVIVPPSLPRQWPPPQQDSSIRSMLDGGVPEAFVLISHGGFHRRRNTSELLRALSMLPKRFRLVMTNSQFSHAEFEILLSQFDLTDRVVRLPRLPFTEMLRYTANADLGVLLYTNNDLGNYFQAPGRLFEYVANGIPVLASNFVGLDNLIRRYHIGTTVDQNAESIAAGILKAENNPPAAKHIRGVFDQHLAFDLFAPDAVAAFRNLMN